jgi:hypothetical protein
MCWRSSVNLFMLRSIMDKKWNGFADLFEIIA